MNMSWSNEMHESCYVIYTWSIQDAWMIPKYVMINEMHESRQDLSWSMRCMIWCYNDANIMYARWMQCKSMSWSIWCMKVIKTCHAQWDAWFDECSFFSLCFLFLKTLDSRQARLHAVLEFMDEPTIVPFFKCPRLPQPLGYLMLMSWVAFMCPVPPRPLGYLLIMFWILLCANGLTEDQVTSIMPIVELNWKFSNFHIFQTFFQNNYAFC